MTKARMSKNHSIIERLGTVATDMVALRDGSAEILTGSDSIPVGMSANPRS